MGLFSFFSNKENNKQNQSFNTLPIKSDDSFLASFNRHWGGLTNPEYDLSSPYVDNVKRGYRYIKFGEDNLYPYHLINMYNSSAMHSSCIKFITDILLSSNLNFISSNLKTKSLEDKIRIENIKNIFDDDFLERFIQEFLIHGRVCFIVKGKEEGKGFRVSNLKLVGAEKVRVAANNEGFYVSEDWQLGLKDSFKEKFDKLNPKDGAMICLQKLGPGQNYYPVPQYTSAANWIFLDKEIAYFQKQNIINSVNPSAVLTLFEKFHNPEEKQKFIDNLKYNLSSAKNGGKILILNAKDRESAPEFEMLDANKLDESFAAVNESIVENIARAHQISPVVMGISTAGKLGSTSEIQDAFNIFYNGKLSRLNKLINKQLNELIDLFDSNITVNLPQNNPFNNNTKNT